jgi:anhydro-N-acetylmuramic acid kinase
MQLKRQELKAIGLMSGTSLDGIDAAIITTDGEGISGFGEFITLEYSDEFRQRLRRAIEEARGWRLGVGEVSDKELERDLTDLHAEAVKKLGVKADIIGFHGQTIIHRPQQGFTWQMGDGALLAKLTGIDVVNDFRSSDIKAGGQGAPLVPVFHKAITLELPKPIAIVNIGGVANITWIDEQGNLLAFDTGPGNAMINDIMKKHFGKDYDENGVVAARGQVDEEVLAEYLDDEYFKVRPPKSLDRNHFNLDLVRDLKPEDAVATLTAFTALSIMMSNSYFKSPVPKFYITGGGRKNRRIMETLGDRAESIEAIKHNGDAFEAQAFAYLAVRVKYGLPITFPTTTGRKVSPLKNIAQYHKV